MSDNREQGSKLEVNAPNTSEPPRVEQETVRPRSEPRRERSERAETRTQDRPPHAGTGTNRPVILSVLYLTSIIVGITGLIAFILALVWKSEPGEAWEASHYDYHIMTFALWAGTTILSVILIFTIIGVLIGFPLLFLAVIWVVIRAIMSLTRAMNREPMPNPGTWLA